MEDTGARILVAEDSEDDAFLLQRALKANGVSRPPQIVHDGAAAIQYLAGEPPFNNRIEHPFPNMLLLDLKMPKLSGFDVLKWLGEHPDLRVIPTIVWTSSADLRDIKHSYCLGVNAYLCKPIHLADYVKVIGNILQFWNIVLKPSVQPGNPRCDELESLSPLYGSHH